MVRAHPDQGQVVAHPVARSGAGRRPGRARGNGRPPCRSRQITPMSRRVRSCSSSNTAAARCRPGRTARTSPRSTMQDLAAADVEAACPAKVRRCCSMVVSRLGPVVHEAGQHQAGQEGPGVDLARGQEVDAEERVRRRSPVPARVGPGCASSQSPKRDSIAPRRSRTRCPLRLRIPGFQNTSARGRRWRRESAGPVPNSSVNQPWPFWARPSTDWGSRSARMRGGAAKFWPMRKSKSRVTRRSKSLAVALQVEGAERRGRGSRRRRSWRSSPLPATRSSRSSTRRHGLLLAATPPAHGLRRQFRRSSGRPRPPVQSAKSASTNRSRVEDGQVVDRLAHAHVAHGQAQGLGDGHDDAALGGAVELGQDQALDGDRSRRRPGPGPGRSGRCWRRPPAGSRDRGRSCLRITRATLPSSSIRLVLVCRRPAVSTITTSTPRASAALRASKTTAAGSAPGPWRTHSHADALGPDLQLLHRRGAEGVAGRQQHLLALALEQVGQLGDAGGLAGAVDARRRR